MSYFSHLIRIIIGNYMVSPWDPARTHFSQCISATFKKVCKVYEHKTCAYQIYFKREHNRCFNLNSSYQKFHNEIDSLKQIFKLNGYCIQLVNGCIKQFLQNLYVTNAIQDTVNKKQLLIVLLFLGSKSFLVRKRLPSCIGNHLPCCSLESDSHLPKNFLFTSMKAF